MSRVRLTGGAYMARSIIASAQRQVNLYSEAGVPGAISEAGGGGNALVAALRPTPDTPPALYPTPGLRALATPPITGTARGLYWSTDNRLFYCCAGTLYLVNADWTMQPLLFIAVADTPVSMADNGLQLVLVDGSPNGYEIDLSTLTIGVINATDNGPPPNTANPASSRVFEFAGADRIASMDGYLLFSLPNTQRWNASYQVTEVSTHVIFDSTWFATKLGFADRMVAVYCNQRSIWLIGEKTVEIWYTAGGAAANDFPFQIMPGPFINHGCVAKYSIAGIQESLLWLSQDQSGQNICVRTKGYEVVRVSTHALETEWSTYATTADATGAAFQQNGHDFYQLSFPTADKTWRLDVTTGEWHQAVWSDGDGVEHRHRAGQIAFAYGTNVAADWQTGQLYALDPAVFTDNGAPIKRVRGFPHFVSDGNRVVFRSLILDMQPGNNPPASADFSADFNADFDILVNSEPLVSLRWSDDRGRTFGNPIFASLGTFGDYLTSVQFTRLGVARDRVFEIEWDAAGDTALQGAWIVLQPASS